MKSDIGMAHYEKQGKQEAAYPIFASHDSLSCIYQVYKDIGMGYAASYFYIPLPLEEMIFILVPPIFGCIVAIITGGKPPEKQW